MNLSNPHWIWSARLLIEPRRLWKRYLIGNPLFIWRVLKQLALSVSKGLGLLHLDESTAP